MLNYNGINYNLDCLFQFQVLKQLLEALAKKQIEHDSILFGANIKEPNSYYNEENNESKKSVMLLSSLYVVPSCFLRIRPFI